MFIHSHTKEGSAQLEYHLNDEDGFKGVSDIRDWPVTVEIRIGTTTHTIYWTRKEFEDHVIKGQQVLQELDRIKLSKLGGI